MIIVKGTHFKTLIDSKYCLKMVNCQVKLYTGINKIMPA